MRGEAWAGVAERAASVGWEAVMEEPKAAAEAGADVESHGGTRGTEAAEDAVADGEETVMG